jgi:hypothetical protein
LCYLKHQEELAEEALLKQQKKLNKALAYLIRLQKLYCMLYNYNIKIINHSLNTKEIKEADYYKEEER